MKKSKSFTEWARANSYPITEVKSEKKGPNEKDILAAKLLKGVRMPDSYYEKKR